MALCEYHNKLVHPATLEIQNVLGFDKTFFKSVRTSVSTAFSCRVWQGRAGWGQIDRPTTTPKSPPFLLAFLLTLYPPCNNLHRRQLKLAPAASCSTSSACASSSEKAPAESFAIAGCCGAVVWQLAGPVSEACSSCRCRPGRTSTYRRKARQSRRGQGREPRHRRRERNKR